MPLSRETIMERLELEPWEEFRDNAIHRNLTDLDRVARLLPASLKQEKHRRTGRTTRMFVSALVAMSKGLSVNIMANGSYRTRNSHTVVLRDRLRDLADKLGLDPALVRSTPDADVEFFDHTYWEAW